MKYVSLMLEYAYACMFIYSDVYYTAMFIPNFYCEENSFMMTIATKFFSGFVSYWELSCELVIEEMLL